MSKSSSSLSPLPWPPSKWLNSSNGTSLVVVDLVEERVPVCSVGLVVGRPVVVVVVGGGVGGAVVVVVVVVAVVVVVVLVVVVVGFRVVVDLVVSCGYALYRTFHKNPFGFLEPMSLG